MKITTILFDLDGTLLPMDNEEFTREYFKLLCRRLVPLGYDSKALVDGVWAGTYAMVKNDGSCTNEKAFWNKFAEKMGILFTEPQLVFHTLEAFLQIFFKY